MTASSTTTRKTTTRARAKRNEACEDRLKSVRYREGIRDNSQTRADHRCSLELRPFPASLAHSLFPVAFPFFSFAHETNARFFSFLSLPLLLPLSPPRSSCFFSRGYFNLGLATRSTAPEPSTFHRPPGCRRATTSLAPARGTGMQMLAPAEIRRISTGRSLTKQLTRGVAYTAAGNVRGEQAAWRTEFKAAEP